MNLKVALGATGQKEVKDVADYFGTIGLKVSIVPVKVGGQPGNTTKAAENNAQKARENVKNAGLGVGLAKNKKFCIVSVYNGIQFFSSSSMLDYTGALDEAFTNFLDNRPYRIGAIAYIFDKDNKILIDQLTSYAYEDWNFPGGGRDEGETALENVLREVREELNISSDDLKLIKQTKQPIQYDFPLEMLQAQHISAIRHKGQIKDQFIFKFIGDKNKIKVDPAELRTYKWVNVADLKMYLTFPNQYKISIDTINKYLEE